jgi:transposase-like protein
MPKKRVLKRLPKAKKAMILKEAEAKGLTAEQVEKRYGVSKWTFYGWRKRRAKSPARAGVLPLAAAPSEAMIRRELRAVLPGILRQEIAIALAGIFAKRAR